MQYVYLWHYQERFTGGCDLFQPVIKWTGSKRSQAKEIIARFPHEINVYYEPFIGGGSVLRCLLENKHIFVNKIICSDINKDLIDLWKTIQNNWVMLSEDYSLLWNELNKDNDISRKKCFYNSVRERCNIEYNPSDFLFISRTCVNGLIRYNKKGEFNSSFHFKRNGIKPESMGCILKEWSCIIRNVEFICCDYKDIHSRDGDFLYLDPPYFATNGMYYGALDYSGFFKWLRNQKGKYMLSFDGMTNKKDYTIEIPHDIYDKHEYLNAGNSSFRRLNGKSKDTYVKESIYWRL